MTFILAFAFMWDILKDAFFLMLILLPLYIFFRFAIIAAKEVKKMDASKKDD